MSCEPGPFDCKVSIKFGDETLGTAQGAGKTNVWVTELGAGSGQFVGMAVFDDASSSTGKKLIITKGVDTSNTIVINNFDLSAAYGAGYLGIKLEPTQRLALIQGDGTTVGASTANVYADTHFTDAQLAGKSSNVVEGGGKAFSIFLAQAARAGDTLTLANITQERYIFSSCLRNISLGYRPIRHINKHLLRTKCIRHREAIKTHEVRV